MRLGDLRHLLVHEVAVEGREPDGGVTTTWEAQGVAWGHLEPLSGRKLELAQRQEPRATHRLTLRYHSTQRVESAASVLNLSPVTLSAQDHSTSELLRTL